MLQQANAQVLVQLEMILILMFRFQKATGETKVGTGAADAT